MASETRFRFCPLQHISAPRSFFLIAGCCTLTAPFFAAGRIGRGGEFLIFFEFLLRLPVPGRTRGKLRAMFTDQKITVIGTGRSGLDAAWVLARLGAKVTLTDNKTEAEHSEEEHKAILQTGAAFVSYVQNLNGAFPDRTALVVTSPGVPKRAAILEEAERRGLPILSEIELAFRITQAPLIGITGTNGKTTTTVLAAQMLEASEREAIICGNVSADGLKKTLVSAAYETRALPDSQKPPTLVAEISSFQLEWVENFAPLAAVLTNITADHLDRHKDFEEYSETKAQIFAAQTFGSLAIVNYDDPAARSIGETLPPERMIPFSLDLPDRFEYGAAVRDGVLIVRLPGMLRFEPILPFTEFPDTLPGTHSLQNALAAAAAALHAGATPEGAAQAIREFKGVPHRMETVADINGIRYINNSMCTNVAAGIRSLEAMTRPTILLAGGVDKGSDFCSLVPALKNQTKFTLLYGKDAGKLERAFRESGYNTLERVETLEEAVRKAADLAVSGDTVLLAPICASFDQFTNFEQRGETFRKIVQRHAAEVQNS